MSLFNNKIKPVFRRKPKPIGIVHSAKVITAVNDWVERGVLKFDGNTAFVFQELLNNPKTSPTIIKNFALYARIKDLTKAGEILHVKNIETGERIAFFQNNKATFFK